MGLVVCIAFLVGVSLGTVATRLWTDWRGYGAPTPAPTSAPDAPAPGVLFDAARMRHALRSADNRELNIAYQRTFAGHDGRLALAHWAARCGVGGRSGPGLTPDERSYLAGRHDAAIDLISLAGFDQSSAVVAVMSDQNLEIPNHERTDPHAYAYADPDADPDAF